MELIDSELIFLYKLQKYHLYFKNFIKVMLCDSYVTQIKVGSVKIVTINVNVNYSSDITI